MVTPRTQAAIVQLNHIHAGNYDSCPKQHIPAEEARRSLLPQLTAAGLIIPKGDNNPMEMQSYKKSYIQYGTTAQNPGVVHPVSGTYLQAANMSNL